MLGNFSIHSFVELGLMNYLLTFIAVFALLGFGMLAWRWREVHPADVLPGVPAAPQPRRPEPALQPGVAQASVLEGEVR